MARPLSYLYHVSILKKTPARADEYASIDVESELAELDLSSSVMAAFERQRPGKGGAPQ